jgi:hypothetical protein
MEGDAYIKYKLSGQKLPEPKNTEDDKITKSELHCNRMKSLENAYRGDDMHLPRTLDQSLYGTLEQEDLRKRAMEQVVYRYTNSNAGESGRTRETRILMVSQLWLWKIDDRMRHPIPFTLTSLRHFIETLITAFPERWYQGVVTTLLDHIRDESSGFRSISSLDKLIDHIVRQTVDSLYSAEGEENYFDIFDKAVSAVVG